jgi:predicted transcriptional regulator YdeE
VKFAVESFPGRRVIGKGVTLVEGEMKPEDTDIEELWERMQKDGSLERLTRLPHQAGAPGDTVGWMGYFAPPDMHFTYLAGVMFEVGTPAPEGFIFRDLSTGELAHAWIQDTEDPEGGEMHAEASGITSRAVQEQGYEYDGSRGRFEMEYQTFERFYAPLKRGERPMLEFFSPCKKKDTERG